MSEVILLVIVVSIDCFACALTYGLCRIRVGFLSVATISLAGSFVLWLALMCSQLISRFLPPEIAQRGGGILLILMGIMMIFKRMARKCFRGKGCSLGAIFLDETKADIDGSKDISVKEALFLSFILSTDCMLSGLSAGLGFSDYQRRWSVILNFFVGIFAIYLGLFIGKLFSKRLKRVDLSVLDGMVLIMLGSLLTVGL